MSKEEQEYIDNLKEAISEMIEDLEDIRDGIVKVSEAKGHVKWAIELFLHCPIIQTNGGSYLLPPLLTKIKIKYNGKSKTIIYGYARA
jgi:hypothetical protein